MACEATRLRARSLSPHQLLDERAPRATATIITRGGYAPAFCRLSRVRAAFFAASRLTRGPFVLAAFFAAARRALAGRCRAARFACRESASREAALRRSRLSALRLARARRGDVVRRFAARVAYLALRLVVAFALAGGAGSLTPAWRALESPIAIACLAERAPCLPSRT